MNILMLYYYFGTPKGGWSTRAYEFTKRWVNEGLKVSVITSVYDKSDLKLGKGLYEIEEYEGVKVYKINIYQSNKHSFFKRIWTFIASSAITCYLVLKLDYDLILASSGPISVGFPALIGRFIRNKKYIFEVRDLWPAGAISLGIVKNRFIIKICYFLEKILYKYSTSIVTCSTGMSKNIINRFPKYYDKIFEIPNSCDVQLFQTKTEFVLPEKYKNKFLLCYTGSLGLMDNCKQLIEGIVCFNSLYPHHADDVRFVFIGDGAERKILQNFVRNNGLNESVSFLGLIPKIEVIGWLQNASVGMLVFKDNEIMDTCSPNKFFDYLSAGLPVIQSTRGWLKDVLINYNNGYNFEPNNPRDFADAVFQLYTNRNDSEMKGKNSLNLAINVFNRDILASHYVNIINNAYRK